MAHERRDIDMKPKHSQLFSYNILDVKDDLDERLEDCQKSLSPCIANSVKETELYEQLNAKVCRSQQDHDETVLALLYLILTNPDEGLKWYSTLTMVTRDSMATVLQMSELLILEKLPRLLDTTRSQLIWLSKELIRSGVNGADRLCFAFLKQMPGGSSTQQDVWLAERVLHLLLDSRKWVESHSPLVASVVFTYLSLLPCHLSLPSLSQLKDDEVQLVLSLLRNKFQDCIQIGRDLLRLLQNVSRVPEFAELWYDIMNSPTKLSPAFTGINQLLSKRTSRRFIAGRIVTDAEIKLNFMLSKVKFGQHKRYQEWFTTKYLSSADGVCLIPELIRFVCCVIHPSNEVLGSDVVPRWAVIGWLLSLCQTNQVVFMNAKLSLFYDWLSYSSDSDNIMNIEPAALLMFNSLRTHPQVTVSLLDFICRLIHNYCPAMESQIRDGFYMAFNDIVSKGVLPSIEGLLFSVKIDNELRSEIKSVFPEFSPKVPAVPAAIPVEAAVESSESDDVLIIDDTPIESDVQFSPLNEIPDEDEAECDEPLWDVEGLPVILQEKLQDLKTQGYSLNLLNDLLTHIQTEKYSNTVMEKLCQPLIHCISDDLIISCADDMDNLEERPFYRIISMLDGVPVKLDIIRNAHYKMGYLVLFYCQRKDCYELYKPITDQQTTLREYLCQDLKVCVEEDRDVFFSMLPVLCRKYSEEMIGCSQLLYIIVTNIDPHQLNDLVLQLSLKKFVLFGKQLQDAIIDSLSWDSFDQFCFWQLLCGEGPEAHHVVPVLKHITSPNEHPEAVTGIVLLLRQEPSIPSAVGNLLSLPRDGFSCIVVSVISRWINLKPNKMAKFIDYCLGKVQKLSDPLPTVSNIADNLEDTLCHLATDDMFKASDFTLCNALMKMFEVHTSLVSRCQVLYDKVNQFKNEIMKLKRRKSSDDDSNIGRNIKRKRVLTIEELSD